MSLGFSFCLLFIAPKCQQAQKNQNPTSLVSVANILRKRQPRKSETFWVITNLFHPNSQHTHTHTVQLRPYLCSFQQRPIGESRLFLSPGCNQASQQWVQEGQVGKQKVSNSNTQTPRSISGDHRGAWTATNTQQ